MTAVRTELDLAARANHWRSRREVVVAAGLMLGGLATARLAHGDPAGTEAPRGPMVNVDDHGASVHNTSQANMAAFRAALAAVPAGGTLLVPNHGREFYLLDTSSGLSGALAIDRPMTVTLLGGIRSTHGEMGPNPPIMFLVSGSDVAFGGSGTIAGPGPADDRNELDDRFYPCLIRVTGDRFRFVGPTIRDVPKIGIHLWACSGAVISARWLGGIKDYQKGHTALFGVRATGGGGHRLVSNRFERDEQGRRLISGYFAGGWRGGTRGDELTNNFADVHEKLAYLYTTGSRIANCHVVDAQETDILRIVGSGNIVEKLTSERTKGGVSIYNGSGNVVKDCVFKDIGQTGIVVSFQGSYSGGYRGTVVSGNTILANAESTGLQDGICLYVAGGDTSGMAVTGNKIGALGGAIWRNCIRLEAIPPYFFEAPIVKGNAVSGARNGVSIRRRHGGDVTQNRATGLHGGEPLLQIET